MRKLVLSLSLLLSTVAFAACDATSDKPTGSDPNENDMDSSMPLPDGGSAEATWHGGVGELLTRECAGCHAQGASSAPFEMTYDEAKKWAGSIKEQTEARRMPPMPANNDGSCHKFRNARWLEDDEIALIGAWVDAGTPLGDPNVAVPGPVDNHISFAPNYEITTPAYTPDTTLDDDYRCFVMDIDLTAAKHVAAFQFVPGNTAIVHHATVYPIADAALANIQARDDADPGPGYQCFGSSSSSFERPLLFWTPGNTVQRMPDGTGLIMPAVTKVVVQLHYNTIAGPGTDPGTSLQIESADTVETKFALSGLVDLGLDLEPGKKSVTNKPILGADTPDYPLDGYFGYRRILADYHPGYTIYALVPHMHKLGTKMRVTSQRVHADGSLGEEECLFDVDRYDFNWQNMWWYDKPLELHPEEGTQIIKLTCEYDTSTRNEPIKWGEGTAQEMCVVGWYSHKDGL